MHHAFARQYSAPSMDEGATQCALVETDPDLIRESRQHATRDRSGPARVFLQIETFVACDGEELFPELARFARGARIDTELRATSRIESILFCKTKGTLQDKKIGLIVVAE
jgi:hypothetical protein